MTGTIKSTLRNRLRPRKSKKFLRWIKEKHPYLDAHHILASTFGLKYNDYLISVKTHQDHMRKHYKAGVEDFESDLVEALEHLQDYIEELEGEK